MLHTTRRTARLGVVGILGAGLALLAATPASASTPSSYAAAVADNTADQANAAASAASMNLANPNITCTIPKTFGVTVAKATDAYYAEVDGWDTATGAAGCASATNPTYTITFDVHIEWYNEARADWESLCGLSATRNAVSGVAVAQHNRPVLCSYDVDHPAANTPHRAHAILTHSLDPDAAYHGYGPVSYVGDRLPVPPAPLGDVDVSGVPSAGGVSLSGLG